MGGIGTLRGIVLHGIFRADTITSIAGQRQRHSPSIGIRVVGIEVCRWCRQVKLQFLRSALQPVTCVDQQSASINCTLLKWHGRNCSLSQAFGLFELNGMLCYNSQLGVKLASRIWACLSSTSDVCAVLSKAVAQLFRYLISCLRDQKFSRCSSQSNTPDSCISNSLSHEPRPLPRPLPAPLPRPLSPPPR